MNDKIEVKRTIEDANKYLTEIFSSFGEIESDFNDIDSKLGQSLWAGKAHDECVDVNGVLKVYEAAIRPICEDLKIGIEKLNSDSKSFHLDSKSIKVLKAW